ncbi:hypothetical protein C922_04485 [Plasmodium inui San Antonio 1]|uniref:Tryptophan/threonine-rich plasmodium antigen C-terminal domain-containing protein n=1 Tax=Plasmodium inui San Antonio 1 TaxID=1237626 RepID=W7A0J3_9APIC|nr:hypothetical protein C922_04485 [Plasmodium inui San Antonio 1]EUD65085.1 hypothetical protein C922_04485 [Plasmodium inui San Antonio 1]
MTRVELDWKDFDNSINDKKEKCLEERMPPWEEFQKQIEHKWNLYNEHLDIAYKSYILKISPTWNVSHWEE